MSASTIFALVIAAVVLAGCAGEGQRDEGEAGLAHTLRFESRGFEGTFRLTLEPDGSAEGQLGAADPFTFTVDDDELAMVATRVEDADLANQPREIEGDEGVTDETTFEFEFGDAHVEAEWTAAPDEIRQLGEKLEQLVRDNSPDR